jgi:hypothetical protein
MTFPIYYDSNTLSNSGSSNRRNRCKPQEQHGCQRKTCREAILQIHEQVEKFDISHATGYKFHESEFISGNEHNGKDIWNILYCLNPWTDRQSLSFAAWQIAAGEKKFAFVEYMESGRRIHGVDWLIDFPSNYGSRTFHPRGTSR